ncbi:MAG: hypothetical protein K8R02_04950 [Anaerohalosphaeraceae bacterium]|nr:hypothetical protein [Anaerohalosphaeraceae bacterium]
MKKIIATFTLIFLCVCSSVIADSKLSPAKLLSYPSLHGKIVFVKQLRIDKVTYQSLKSTVKLKAILQNPTVVAQEVNLEFRIEEPLTSRVLKSEKAKIALKPKIIGNATAELSITVPQMTGLLAAVIVTDTEGNILDKGMRPFDVTDNIRRNFRYAGAAFDSTRKFNPNIDDVVRDHLAKRSDSTMTFFPEFAKKSYFTQKAVAITPRDEAELVYQAFHNCALAFLPDFRGHFTPWEEWGNSWPQSMYGITFATAYLDRLVNLNKALRNRGIMPEIWITIECFHHEYMDSRHPWIQRDTNGTPIVKHYNSYEMDRNLSVNHPLSPEEEAMMASYSHGAVNWIDYLVKEYVMVSKLIGCRSFWADNRASEEKGFITMMERINKELGYRMFIKSNFNERICKDGVTDTFWVETRIKNDMAEQMATMREVLGRERDPGVTITWANDGNGGPKQPYSDDRNSPKIVNNDPNMTHMYRQYLLESIAMDPNLIDVQNTPRNFTYRYGVFTEAFREHCRTWGFQTLYTHFFNSPDIELVNDSAKIVSITNCPASFDDALKAGTIHIRVTKRPAMKQTIIHLFNYVGTEATNLIKRPHPTKQEAVNVKFKLTNQTTIPVIYAVSPDNEKYDEVAKPLAKLNADTVEFDVSVDTYTLVVIQQ